MTLLNPLNVVRSALHTVIQLANKLVQRGVSGIRKKFSRKSFFALSLSSRIFFETWSASITSIPNSIKKSPATDFPEPIPPVRPTIID